MTNFKIHNLETAPKESKEMLRKGEEQFGMIPNVLGIMAESPPQLKGYMTLGALLEETTLAPEERTILLLTVSFENECDYCMAAHTVEAKQIGLDEDVVQALRQGTAIKDQRLEALRTFAATVVRKRGHLSKAEVDAFLSAGYNQANILEVILAVAMKTITNYTNHIAETPLDQAMQSYRWTTPAK